MSRDSCPTPTYQECFSLCLEQALSSKNSKCIQCIHQEVLPCIVHSPIPPPCQDILWMLREMAFGSKSCDVCDGTAHTLCPHIVVFFLSGALHASGLCPLEVCAKVHQCVAQISRAIAVAALALAMSELSTTFAKPLSIDEFWPKVLIRIAEFPFRGVVPRMLVEDSSLTKR